MENQEAESAQSHLSTLDEKEIQFFSDLANMWWDPKGTIGGLHTMNNLRVPFVVESLSQRENTNATPDRPLEGLDILDVGCGGGIVTEALAYKGCNTITGIDVSSELINIAKHHASLDPTLTNIDYSHSSIEEHAEKFPEKYDVLICSEVLEHVNEREILLEACLKCVKPGGSIIVTTLNKTFMSWWMGIVMAEYILRLTKRGTHEWSKFISPEDVTKLLKEGGCSTKTVRGMKFEYLTFPKQWYWSQNTNCNYILHAVKDLK